MSKKKTAWTFESDDPATVEAWKATAPKPEPEEKTEMPQKIGAGPTEGITGPPGTPGFSKRIGRLNKLYHNLTPEQRANHPGFRRLLAVIELEDQLNTSVTESAMVAASQEDTPPPGVNMEPTSTSTDKAQQESQTGINRPLNDFIKKLGGNQ